jgi:excisionase family DNA binding protein
MSTNGTVTGNLLGDCRVELVVDAEHVARLDDLQLAQLVRVGRAILGRLQAEVDLLAAELARRGRDVKPGFTPAAALTVEEAAARLSMSKNWLYKQARKGALPFARRVGRRLVLDEGGLTRWLARRPRVYFACQKGIESDSMTRRRGPGRPRVYRHRAKVTVQFEAAELRAINHAARDAGVPVSTWLRRAALVALRDTGRTA